MRRSVGTTAAGVRRHRFTPLTGALPPDDGATAAELNVTIHNEPHPDREESYANNPKRGRHRVLQITSSNASARRARSFPI